MKGSDLLGDSSVLFLGNGGVSEIIDKSGFSVINMTHNGDDRRFLPLLVFAVCDLSHVKLSVIYNIYHFQLLFR